MFGNSLIFVGLIAAYLTFLLYIIITIVITFYKEEGRCSHSFSEAMLIFSEVLFTIIGPVIGFYRFDEFGPDIPFAKQHVFSVIVLVISSSACFWISRFTLKTPNPVLRIIVSTGLFQGIVLCLITSIHFISYFPMGIIYPTLGFELLSPLVALLLLVKQFYFYNKEAFDFSGQLPYRNELGFTPLPVRIIESSFSTRLLIIAALCLPFVIVQVLFAFGCGQDPDALLKAYTHSHGFIFSM